jgi:hypothetical protein
MRGLDSFDIDIKQCLLELEEFENLLRNKYLSKINLTFLEKRKISVFLISCSLFPVPSPKYKIYFARLLNRELKENEDILPFFKDRPNLSACIGWYSPDNLCNQIKHEFTLFGDFRADLVVGDSRNNTYCFIEFEDATKDSIFKNKKGKSTSE